MGEVGGVGGVDVVTTCMMGFQIENSRNEVLNNVTDRLRLCKQRRDANCTLAAGSVKP